MNTTLFIITFFLLQIACVWIGRKVSKKNSTQEDYFLAGRGLSFFPLMMTLVATQVGGGLVLGSAEEAYKYGWSVFLYPLGASLGLLFLALGIGKRMASFKVGTVAALFEVVYQSKRLKKCASLLSIISLFLILVAQVIASKKFLLSCGVSADWIFIAFWGLVILYTVSGGLKAVVATDIIQATFFILIFFGGFAYSLFASDTNLLDLFNSKPTTPFEFSGSKFSGWLLMPLLFMIIEQDMGQRCFAAKSSKAVGTACLTAAIVTFTTCLIPLVYGVLAKVNGLTPDPNASILMTVVSATTNPFVTALIGCAILAAIISTADSLMNAISSNIAQDFDIKIKSVRVAQMITASIALLALFGTYFFNNVVDLLILSYELSVSALFVPIFMALFLKRGRATSATSAIICGAIGFIVFRYVHLTLLPKEILALMFSFAGFCVAEVMSKDEGLRIKDEGV